MLALADADYADIRHETKTEARITFSGRELVGVSSSSADGYVLRVLKNGGFATIAFTRPGDAGRAARTASKNALVISRNAKRPVRLAPVAPARDSFVPSLEEDPRSVSIDDKLALTRHYNDIPLSNPKVATTSIGYADVTRVKHFLSTEGSEVHEELVTSRISGSITAMDGSLFQTTVFGVGGSDGFARVRGREAEVEAKTRVAVDLLRAEPVKAGTYGVVLDPKLAGVFTHEAFGHFSEADLIEDSPTMREKMKFGARLGSDVVNIKDDPTLPHQLGFYKYDDEGVAAGPVQLMKAGVLTGRLHSRRTAAAFDESPTGHCVAEDYRYAPIIRMGNIFIEPAKAGLDELLAQLGEGLYLVDSDGGQTTGENFTFGAQYGFVIKGGRRAGMVRDINISGNLYRTLENICAVGGDLELGEMGGCGKGQANIRSCYGAPHVLVENVVVGGR